MKKIFLNYAVALVSTMVVFTACKEDEVIVPPPPVVPTSNEVILKTDISGTRNLVKDSVYVIEGQINVSGVLNIAAGTVIKGDKVTKGTLVVVQGGKLNAMGTATAPIVFTSRQAPGLRNSGDWGGIVLVGKATCNQTAPKVEGLSRDVSYGGGTDDADNSGTLQYVRIEFAGIALQPDKEINGLTMCAVGSGTTIDHIQVSYSGDDSFEWFGGKVDAKYIVAYLGLDDDFDTDYGYRGKVQYGLAVRNPRIADVSGSNGFESDNDGSGSTATPKTAAIFSNITMIGAYQKTSSSNVQGSYGAGAHIRRNSSLSIFNSVFAGWNTAGILIDGTTTYANATAGDLVIKNTVVSGTKVAADAIKGSGVTTADAAAWFSTSGKGNSIVKTNDTPKIAINKTDSASITASFFNPTATTAQAFTFIPAGNSPLLNAADFTDSKLASGFDKTSVTNIGAFGSTDWTTGWTNFDPQNTVY